MFILAMFSVACSTKHKVGAGAAVLQAPILPPPVIVDSTLLLQPAPALDTAIHNATPSVAPIVHPSPVDSMLQYGIDKVADWAPAMHYDLRKPQFVIIHHTAQHSTAQTVRTFQLAHTQVSAHYVVGRDGQVIQMLNDMLRAWHAGRSKWGSILDINSVSLGIELDNNGKEPFPDVQIQALLRLLDTLKTKYRIPVTNFIGHGDIAVGRKDDPSTFFPWQTLAQSGFGVWYDASSLVAAPLNFNALDALRIIGYDVSAPQRAIRAFKRKFIGVDNTAELSAQELSVLFAVYKRYY